MVNAILWKSFVYSTIARLSIFRFTYMSRSILCATLYVYMYMRHDISPLLLNGVSIIELCLYVSNVRQPHLL